MATRKTAPKRASKFAYVEVGYMSLVIEADKAIQVVKLLGDAVACDRQYDARSYLYHVTEPLQVSMTILRPDQIRFPTDEPSRPALEHKPTTDFFE
ncbi:hypothetical protein [Burkholderia perseverans]|uniref:hypothetical protein n=1 Tax=Burkholderia perseverans TaxID=2615214 RepID=UPI001FEE90F0|nr:hypothetical protein [Burkholderia perseverans]